MYYIEIPKKPKDCAYCPLSHGEKRDCGRIKAVKSTNADVRHVKQPDERCKIKEM